MSGWYRRDAALSPKAAGAPGAARSAAYQPLSRLGRRPMPELSVWQNAQALNRPPTSVLWVCHW
jgi:hypothetical protein